MEHIVTILPGQWQQHYHRRYAVWVHRLARAVSKEIDQLPAQPPPLPWPIRRDPINEIRAYNSSLFPRVPVNPNPRVYLNTYVPKTVDLDRARTEVYRPDKGEDWLWRIRICWDEPRPWEIEAFVDPGGALYLPFFRQVIIRLPLKAKICRDLKARKDGQWVGNCQSVKKLNAREPITGTTTWLLESGQDVMDRYAETLTEQPPPGRKRPLPYAAGTLTLTLSQREKESGELGGAARREKKPAKAGTPKAAHSPGAVAYRAKVAARKREEERANLAHYNSLVTAHARRWPVEYETPLERRERWDHFEREQAAELEAIGVILQIPEPIDYRFSWPKYVDYGPDFQRRDDLDGYLVTRQEVGPDPFDYDWPKKRARPPRRTRKRKRPSTARDRLAAVKPSVRIVATGPRSAELVITRRMHEVKTGLPEALDLARMIEGAIKYRNPPQPNRKASWRQQLRSAVLYRPGLLTWLVRNPMNYPEPGARSQEPGVVRTTTPGAPVSAQAPDSRLPALLLAAPRPGKKPPKGGTPNACFRPQPRTPNPQSRALRAPAPDSRLPAPALAGLPKDYLDLVDRQWLTPDSNLFEATPVGGFATTVEGYRLRLPLAVMPPAVYERWLARGGGTRRRRKRPKGLVGGCCCYFPPALTKVRVGRSSASARSPAFRRNRNAHVPLD